ncbi:DNA/RNA nuclease SfsA [Hyphococcus luteus]|uniref:Sugar fermentation stimulation protein homolog n=1 Tax=Hyphococcus luteus TaxID=2058213 RepID=A0A2S7JZA0_9PROT|nr:DNA/RNA nuclease SfsA [Marinicaulis flavus]PQA85581.1 DNA/RNA nuclease SfsA [Marinicaulis flavus]
MRLPSPLVAGRLVKRYKRFLADVLLDDGREVTAHCANPGSMLGVAVEGAKVWLWEHGDRKRKLAFSWELVEIGGVLIPVNTTNPNRIVPEALDKGVIPELSGYGEIAREVKYGEGSRIDLLLSGGRRKKPCYVEIKNVHLSRTPGLAEFPDSVTKRGAKHLEELSRLADAKQARPVMLFVVQRADCRRFAPAADLDPAYAKALKSAASAGVELLCYDCEVTTSEVVLRKALEIDLETT